MKIEIPDGFFPEPGVPFKTKEQRNLAVALYAIGKIKLQLMLADCWTTAIKCYDVNYEPSCYRIAPPDPKRGEIKINDTFSAENGWGKPDDKIEPLVEAWLQKNRIEKTNIEITIKIEEII